MTEQPTPAEFKHLADGGSILMLSSDRREIVRRWLRSHVKTVFRPAPFVESGPMTWQLGAKRATTDLQGVWLLYAAISARGAEIDGTAFVRPGTRYPKNALNAQLSAAQTWLALHPRLHRACDEVKASSDGKLRYIGIDDIET